MNRFVDVRRRWLAAAAVGAAATLTLAACAKSATTGGGAQSSSAAAFTLMTASVPGVGTVMVNGDGRTLYILSSEAGGRLTCTDANGCTAVWPDTELPSGTTSGIAGTGAQASLLGSVKSADGKLYLTYGGFPLYTYVGDKGPGTAAGQGITSFGGTWTAVTAAGRAAAVAATSSSTTPRPSAKTTSSGYGY